MTTLQFVLFLSGLILPSVFWRMKFRFNPVSFYTLNKLRSQSGLNLHHGHYGLIMLVISLVMLVFGYHNGFTIGLAGFGLGHVADEIMPLLHMPSPGRNKELEIYAQELHNTINLIGALVTVVLIIFVFLYKH